MEESDKINPDDYMIHRDELLDEINKILSNMGDVEKIGVEDRINEINKEIEDLDIKMFKTVIHDLIDPDELTYEYLDNFIELSHEMKGKILEDIVGSGSDYDKIAVNLVKLYDILPYFSTDEQLYDNIHKTVSIMLSDRTENLDIISGKNGIIDKYKRKIKDLNNKLSVSEKEIENLKKEGHDSNIQIIELKKKVAALELKANLDEMEVEVGKLNLGKRKRSGSDSGSDSGEPSKKKDIKENYQDGLTIDNTLNVVFVMLLSSYIALYDGKLPENNLTQTPTNTISDTFKVTLMWWYYNKTNGCFLVTNSGVQRLDGCSDYYGSSIKNQLNCSCGKIGSGLTKPTCDKECFKPYCIGSDNCDKSLTKCSNDQLYQCTGNIGDPNFTYYTYKNNSILSIYSNLLTLQNIFSPDDKSKKSNILLYLFIFIIVILFIAGGLYILRKYKKK